MRSAPAPADVVAAEEEEAEEEEVEEEEVEEEEAEEEEVEEEEVEEEEAWPETQAETLRLSISSCARTRTRPLTFGLVGAEPGLL